jgi:pre-mRNA-splicing factor SYF1
MAAFFIKRLLDDTGFESLNNRNKYYWWSELSAMIRVDPDIENAEGLLLNGCRDFVVETGRMWVLVAELFARLGRFPDAIQTFEDALSSTTSARDFAVVFEGAAQLLLSVASAGSFRMYERKLNDLLDRRELLLNRTLLRENVNNIECWIQRGALYLDRQYDYAPKTRLALWTSLKALTEQHGQVNVFAEAIESVDPSRACEGRYCDLWISLSMLLDSPPAALEAALGDTRLLPPDLVAVYRHYAENALEGGRETLAREILGRAITDDRIRTARGLSELFNLALDIEWCFGGVSGTRALFERCLASRVATLRHIVAYATFCGQNDQPDEMFRTFEKGIATTGWPHCASLWMRYLHSFVQHYGGTKRERTRDLFEEAVKDAPETEFNVFLLYAKFEEDFGLFKRAMAVYRRAAERTMSDEVISVWVSAAVRHLGVAAAREPYEFAISTIRDNRVIEWCIRYASFEARLKELDRSRIIFVHGTQFADPEQFPTFWEAYEQFEIDNGTKETYQEMLSQRNLAAARFNVAVHRGIANAGLAEADEEKELAEAEATTKVMEQEQKIPETIFDAGTFTVLERFRRKGKR